MLESARILASASVIVLIVAVAAWGNLLGRLQSRRLNGGAAAKDGDPEIAARLLLAGVGLSDVAAVLAIAGWFTS